MTDAVPPAALAPEALFSMNALRRAWLSVRRSGQSAGSDRQTMDNFEADSDAELNRLRQQILGGVYQPAPVRRYFIKKASGKQRPICIWAIRDRVAQRVVHDTLALILEPLFLPCSFGFRPLRSVDEAVKAVIRGWDAELRWVLDSDIQDCFGSIPTLALLDQVRPVTPSPLMVKLIEAWLATPVVGATGEVAGVSQGGVISPLLANLYLHRFDEMLTAALPQCQLIRFADDFVVLCKTEDEAGWALEVARRSLENLRLRLNLRKTRLIHFDEGFTFLGVRFKGRWHAPAPQKNAHSAEEDDT